MKHGCRCTNDRSRDAFTSTEAPNEPLTTLTTARFVYLGTGLLQSNHNSNNNDTNDATVMTMTLVISEQYVLCGDGHVVHTYADSAVR